MRKFKAKHRFNYKLFLIIITIIITCVITKVDLKIKINGNNKIINYLLHSTNPYITVNYKDDIWNSIFASYNPFNVVENTNTSLVSYVAATIPRVYIYNTHDAEEYLGENVGVRLAANVLKNNLEKKGIPTLVENESVSNYLKATGLNFYQSYTVSRLYLENVLKIYPNLELIIDLHRDSLDREYTYTMIDGVSYAKVLFVQGMRYDTYKDNMELANKLSDKINAKYSTISKGIMLKDKSYQNPNFNQDLNKNAVLLELGSNNNTWDEVNNTIEILTEVIWEVLNEEES